MDIFPLQGIKGKNKLKLDIPSVNFDMNETDKSTVSQNPNKSDLSLKGDNNTVNVTSTANQSQRLRRPTSNFSIAGLLGMSNILMCIVIFAIHQYFSSVRKTTMSENYKQIHLELKNYVDNSIISAIKRIDEKLSIQIRESVKNALVESMLTAQEGNKNIIRVQLIRDYDEFLIDGKREIKRRDLEGIQDMYSYYMKIGGNHDIPPREFQFSQMIARKEIKVID